MEVSDIYTMIKRFLPALTVAFLTLVLSSDFACGQLQGTYTVNPKLAANATNYKSLDALFTDLSKGTRSDGGTVNGPGIQGATFVQIDTGRFEEKIVVDVISGISSSNSLTLEGAGMGKTRITGEPGSLMSNKVIQLGRDAAHIRFRNMTISNRSAAVMTEVISTNSSKNITFDSCEIIALENPEYYTGRLIGGNFCAAIRYSQDIRFNQCQLIDTGGANIQCYNSQRLEVEKCTMTLTMYRALTIFTWGSYAPVVQAMSPCYIVSTSDVLFNHNDVTVNPGRNPMAMPWKLSFNSCTSVDRPFSIKNNRLLTPGTGISIFNCKGVSGKEFEVYGNEVVGYDLGDLDISIEVSRSDYGKIYHNSLSRTGDDKSGPTKGAAIEISDSKHWKVLNNLIITDKKKAAVAISNGEDISCDYNLYWNTDNYTKGFLRLDAKTYGIDSLFESKTGGMHSVVAQPVLRSKTDLRLTTDCYTGDSLNVSADRFGNARKSWPSVGAFVPLGNQGLDAGLSLITAPENVVTDSNQIVEVLVGNTGSTSFDSITLNYQINNGTVVRETFKPGLSASSCDTFTARFKTIGKFMGCSKVTIWISAVNGKSDDNQANDTIYRFIGRPIAAGTYSIGKNNADYPSILAAIEALECSGIQGDGSVIFDIDSGRYTEQIHLSNIGNLSDTSKLIFRSRTGNKQDVIIEFASSIIKSKSGRAVLDNSLLSVLKLSGVKHTVFDGISFMAIDSTWNSLIHFSNSSEDIRFVNCHFEIPDAPSFYQVNFLVSSNPDIDVSNIVMDSCSFTGGVKQINLNQTVVTDSFIISNSEFKPTNTTHGVYLWQTSNVTMRNNVMDHRTGSLLTGIESGQSDKITITGNRIFGRNTRDAIRIFNGTNQLVANNMISTLIETDDSYHYGISLSNVQTTKVLHNSIALETGHAYKPTNFNYNSALYTSGFGSSSIWIYNNIFSLKAEKLKNNVAVRQATSGVQQFAIDYNLYATNANTHEFGNQLYAPGSNITGTNAKEGYSFFKSLWDLHLHEGPCSGVQGKTGIGITTDFDGETRSTPHIGADETNGTSKSYDLLSLDIVAPEAVVPHLSNQYIKILTINNGASNLNQAKVSLQVNVSLMRQAHIFTSALKPCSFDTITFPYYFDSIGPHRITTYTDTLNLTTLDQNTGNDTLTRTVQVDQMDDAEMRTLYLYNPSGPTDTLLLYKDTLITTAFIQNPLKYPLNERFQITAQIIHEETGKIVWSSTRFLDSIEGFDSKLADFKLYIANHPGKMKLVSYVDYPGDKYAYNDTATQSFYVKTDNDLALVKSIEPIGDYQEEGLEVYPTFEIKNNGSNNQNLPFSVSCIIEQNGSSIYSEVGQINSLDAGKSTIYRFSKPFKAVKSGEITIKVEVKALIDDFAPNNILTYTLEVARSYDLATDEILAPLQGDILPRNLAIIPKVNIENRGKNDVKPYTATCTIYDQNGVEKYQSIRTDSLNVLSTQTIDFDSFTPKTKGVYTLMVYTQYTLDSFNKNDTLTLTFSIKDGLDVSPLNVGVPKQDSILNFGIKNLEPEVRIANVGIEDVTNFFFTYFTIYQGNTMVYQDSKVTNGLTSASEIKLTFKPFEPKSTGTYHTQVFTRLKNDDDMLNDTIRSSFEVRAKRDLIALDILPRDLTKPLEANQDVLSLKTRVTNGGTELITDSSSVILEVRHGGIVIHREQKKTLPKMNQIDTIHWSTYKPLETGAYNITSWVELPNDEVLVNDTVQNGFDVIATHDVSVMGINRPVDNSKLKVNDTLTIETTIVNNGAQDEQIPVVFELFKDQSAQPVFTDNKTISLSSSQQSTLAATPYILGWSGKYRVRVYTNLSADQIRKNDTTEVGFIIDKTSSVQELLSGVVAVYPNPSTGLFHVRGIPSDIEESELSVLNSIGQTIPVRPKSASDGFTLDLSNQSDGIYYLYTITKSETYIVKLVKH